MNMMGAGPEHPEQPMFDCCGADMIESAVRDVQGHP